MPVAPAGASAAALVSAVNGAAPWSALGDLTGTHTGTVERLASACTFGPDVPFDDDIAVAPFAPFAEGYSTTFVQRGDDLVFELGEGLVFGRVEGSRLEEVVRVGAEGVTHYHDGFAITPSARGFDLSGESDWTFYDGYWTPGEVCDGRTAWSLAAAGSRPGGRERDLHFVLRWPAESGADLDLVVEAPHSRFGEEEERAFLGEVQRDCYVLHSAGASGAAGDSLPADWIQPLPSTTLPHHEEIIRCASGAYGRWRIDVVNWSGDESVALEVEIFSGATLGVDPARERWLALLEETIPPHARAGMVFDYPPPPSGDDGSGLVITVPIYIFRYPAQRPTDPLSGSVLGFNRAAALDVPFDEFLENVGLAD